MSQRPGLQAQSLQAAAYIAAVIRPVIVQNVIW